MLIERSTCKNLKTAQNELRRPREESPKGRTTVVRASRCGVRQCAVSLKMLLCYYFSNFKLPAHSRTPHLEARTTAVLTFDDPSQALPSSFYAVLRFLHVDLSISLSTFQGSVGFYVIHKSKQAESSNRPRIDWMYS